MKARSSHSIPPTSILAFVAVLLAVPAPRALAATWQQPTPEELKMTADPTAPGAAGVYLFREEVGDDKLHFHSLYARLKILTEEGKKYADVEMPYFDRTHYQIADVQGRTIHADGTVIPYTGKPIDKLIVKTKDFQYQTKVFTLPDVQVGSILEYRYSLRYDDNYVLSPEWQIQQEIPVRSTHYRFIPTSHALVDGHGNVSEGQLQYSPQLPAGAKLDYLPSSNTYELRMQNVPRLPTEEFMPPMASLSYRVNFYYSGVNKVDEFWKEEGKYWSKDVNRFAAPTGAINDAVKQIVQPSDTAQQKVAKIYDAVMKLENTSFTREHSAQENKEEGLKVKRAEDIWNQKRGNDDEITLLFLSMVRAAGFKSYAMRVTNRDRAFFRPNFLSMSQLDDDVAIVNVDGKEQFFDPGQRYCTFGQLHWKHSMAQGIRQSENGTVTADTPGLSYKQTSVSRNAELSLSPEGQLSGYIRVSMTGAEALRWRQRALTSDEEAVKKKYEEDLQRTLPPGVEVKFNHFLGLADPRTVLMAMLDVSGSLGTTTSKRVFLPSCFFEAAAKPLFSHETRELPIDLQFPYQLTDRVNLKLPANFAAESVPKDEHLSLPARAVYGVKYKVDGSTFTEERALVEASAFYDVKEYPGLRDFYQKMNAQDQQQLVIKSGTAVAAAGAAN